MDARARTRSGLRVRAPSVVVALSAVLILGGCGGSPRGSDYPSLPPVGASPAPVENGSVENGPSQPVTYLPAPYISRTVWVETTVGPSLQVYPTDAGRRVTAPDAQAKAWQEVVAMTSRHGRYGATSPGMRAQFDCHWNWARAVQPDKPSWNLEPGRPVVTEDQMVAARCNPGAPEE